MLSDNLLRGDCLETGCLVSTVGQKTTGLLNLSQPYRYKSSVHASGRTDSRRPSTHVLKIVFAESRSRIRDTRKRGSLVKFSCVYWPEVSWPGMLCVLATARPFRALAWLRPNLIAPLFALMTINRPSLGQ